MLDPTTPISLAALDAVATALLIFQGDRLTYANQSALDLFGCTASELPAVLPLPRLNAAVYDCVLPRPNGSTFAANCHIAPFSQLAASANEPTLIVTIIPVSPAEAALREANARYQTMLDTVPSMVYQFHTTADGQMQFDYASAACLELNGVTPEAVLQSITALPPPHPDELEAYNTAVEESWRNLSLFDWQGRFLRHGDPNDIRWFRMISRPQMSDEGVTIGTGVQIDITEQKQVEAALRQTEQTLHDSEERYRVLVEGSPDTMFFQDSKLRYTWVRNSLVSPENKQAVINKTDLEIMHPSDAAHVTALKRQVLLTGETWRGELYLTVATGRRQYETTYIARRNSEGMIIGLAGYLHDITERKQIEQALRDSEERYRVLVEGSPDTMFFQDTNLRYTWSKNSIIEAVNKQYSIDKTDNNLFPADEAAILNGLKRQVLATGQTWHGELYLTFADGRHYLDSTYIARRDTTGQIVGLAGYLRDITERKRIEQALRDSEERYRLLVEGSPDTMFFQDTDLRYTWMKNPNVKVSDNQATLSITDYELFQPADAAYIIGVKQQVLATGETWHGEIYTNAATGRRYFDAVYIPRRDQHNHIIGLAGYVREITLRKYSEFTLHDSEALVKHLTEYTPFMIYLFDVARNKTVYINNYTANFFGKSIPELLEMGNPVTPDGVHPDDMPAVETYRSARARIADQPNLKPLECRIKNANGEWRWVMSQPQILTHADSGLPKLIATIIIDITERKRTEEIEREHRQLLEVLRDTAALVHNTLDLDEVLDQVLATIGRVVSFDGANIMLVEDNQAAIVRHSGYTTTEVAQIEANYARTDQWSIGVYMANNQQPMLMSDIRDYAKDGVQATLPWIRSFLTTPLYASGKLIGVLTLVSRTPGYYSAAHAERLQAFGNQSAAAIQNALLNQQSQALAANAERQRLARELHDSVTQTLFSASMVAQTLPHLWDRGEGHVRRGLDELTRLTTGALAEMRTMLVELRPTALETADLTDLITYLLNAMAGRTSIQPTLTVEGDWRPPPNVQIAAYRVVQEALNNVTKHAYATRVLVDIQRAAGALQITVSDNGLGFSLSAIPADHFGLDIMHERAADIGATLDIHSDLGQGSTVTFNWSAPDSK